MYMNLFKTGVENPNGIINGLIGTVIQIKKEMDIL